MEASRAAANRALLRPVIADHEQNLPAAPSAIFSSKYLSQAKRERAAEASFTADASGDRVRHPRTGASRTRPGAQPRRGRARAHGRPGGQPASPRVAPAAAGAPPAPPRRLTSRSSSAHRMASRCQTARCSCPRQQDIPLDCSLLLCPQPTGRVRRRRIAPQSRPETLHISQISARNGSFWRTLVRGCSGHRGRCRSRRHHDHWLRRNCGGLRRGQEAVEQAQAQQGSQQRQDRAHHPALRPNLGRLRRGRLAPRRARRSWHRARP